MLLFVAVLGLATGGVWWRNRPAPPRASLLLITIDTLRSDRVGAYGSTAGLTPNIDTLASNGWLFENVMAAAPLTLPSHSTILSGLYPFHHGVRNNGTYVFPETRETLATRLKADGYSTAAFVSAVVLDRRFGLTRGFDTYDDQISRVSEGRNVLESERPCEVVTGRAATWMQSQTGPFFAWVHIYEPHAPYAPSDAMKAAHPKSAYDAEVATADACLSTILAAARDKAGKDLVIAVTSDHGEGLGDHGESAHGLFVYQSTLGVPMIFSGRGVPEGKRTKDLARSADLAPTLLGLLGAAPLTGIDGRDLSRETSVGEAYAESDYATGFGWAPLKTLRLGPLKYIDAPRPELYDLTADPREENNLVARNLQDVTRFQSILKAALSTEVRGEGRRMSRETEERLRSLGYVSSAPSSAAAAQGSVDPKDALPQLEAFERAISAEASGDLKASIAELQRLTSASPGNVTFERSLASALRRGGRVSDAISVLKAALTRTPQNADLAHDLSIALSEAGDALQSIEYEKRALASDPANVDALDHLASLLATRGDFVEARKAADAALAIDANNAKAWVNRGNIARAQNLADDAERDYRRALELDPRHVDALNGLGVLAVEKGRLDEAAELFEQVLSIDEGLQEARLNLAVVEAQRGRIARAIDLASDLAKRSTDPSLRAKAAAFLRTLNPSSR